MEKHRNWLCAGIGLVAVLIFFFVFEYNFFRATIYVVVAVGLTYVLTLRRLLVFTALGAYQIGGFIFTYLVDGHLDLLGMLKYIPRFKDIAIIGLIILVVDVTWHFIELRASKQEKASLLDENISLKAKLYDLQEGTKQEETKKS